MDRPFRFSAILLFAALPALPAAAQDLEAGRRIAQTWCRACHETDTAAARNDASPSFKSIAQMPSTTEMSLRVFLSTPHHRMPDYGLSRQEIADVSAYILSLHSNRPAPDVN